MAEKLLNPGRNIAMKVPPHRFDETVRFYAEVVGLNMIADLLPDIVFEFGPMRLWIDRVETLSQSEIWLELVTPNVNDAAKHLESHGTTRCDPIEPLPEGFGGFWIASPCDIVHLVAQDD
jgi:hypothetical protein